MGLGGIQGVAVSDGRRLAVRTAIARQRQRSFAGIDGMSRQISRILQLRHRKGGAANHQLFDAIAGKYLEGTTVCFRIGLGSRTIRIQPGFEYSRISPSRCHRYFGRVISPLDIDGQFGDALIPIGIRHRVPDVIAQAR